MSRKPKQNRAERMRRKEQRQKQQENDLVQDTIAQLECSSKTAEDMLGQCNARLDDIDVDLTFATLAIDVWSGRPGRGAELAPLVAELVAEQRRHADVMEALARRFRTIVDAEHEHLPDGVVDPALVRRILFTPPEDRPPAVDRQISTESDCR